MTSKRDFTSYTPDELSELYKQDPALFDELADEAIKKACVARTQEKSLKLQQMQWSIGMQLHKSSSKIGRMRIMEEIFYRRVYGENGELEKLVTNCNSLLRVIGKFGRAVGGKEEPVKLRRV